MKPGYEVVFLTSQTSENEVCAGRVG